MKLVDITGIRPPAKYSGNSNMLVDNDTYVGLEFEVEGFRDSSSNYNHLTYLKCVGDSSLRNFGMELIFRSPFNGNNIIQAVEEYINVCNELAVEFSKRTSIHVHLDMREATTDDITRLVATYLIIERILYKFIGNMRDASIFCIPCYKASGDIKDIVDILDGPSTASDFINTRNKYAGMFLGPLSTQGSVEFRHMEGNMDFNRIITWINILLSIKKFAMSTDKSPREILIEAKRGDARSFLIQVFGGGLANTLEYLGMQEDYIKGVVFGINIFNKKEVKEYKKKLEPKKSKRNSAPEPLIWIDDEPTTNWDTIGTTTYSAEAERRQEQLVRDLNRARRLNRFQV